LTGSAERPFRTRLDTQQCFAQRQSATRQVSASGYAVNAPYISDPNGEPIISICVGRYDPATDSWRQITTAGAHEARLGHSAVWTGDSMIVWGGSHLYTVYGDGAR
jgi:N-acetylneuraminic acid mutarotase